MTGGAPRASIGSGCPGTQSSRGYSGLIDHVVVCTQAISSGKVVVPGGKESAPVMLRRGKGKYGYLLIGELETGVQYWKLKVNFKAVDCLGLRVAGGFSWTTSKSTRCAKNKVEEPRIPHERPNLEKKGKLKVS